MRIYTFSIETTLKGEKRKVKRSINLDSILFISENWVSPSDYGLNVEDDTPGPVLDITLALTYDEQVAKKVTNKGVVQEYMNARVPITARIAGQEEIDKFYAFYDPSFIEVKEVKPKTATKN